MRRQHLPPGRAARHQDEASAREGAGREALLACAARGTPQQRRARSACKLAGAASRPTSLSRRLAALRSSLDKEEDAPAPRSSSSDSNISLQSALTWLPHPSPPRQCQPVTRASHGAHGSRTGPRWGGHRPAVSAVYGMPQHEALRNLGAGRGVVHQQRILDLLAESLFLYRVCTHGAFGVAHTVPPLLALDASDLAGTRDAPVSKRTTRQWSCHLRAADWGLEVGTTHRTGPSAPAL